MKKIVLTGMMLCLTASMALAAGFNFTWNTSAACPATPIANQTWDCTQAIPDVNSGSFFMVVTVQPHVALPAFNALDMIIDGQSVGPVPAWWQTYNAGSCRATDFAITPVTTNAVAPTMCTTATAGKLWTTTPYGGQASWVVTGNRFRTLIGYATAGSRAANLSITAQYNVLSILMDSNNTLLDPDNASVTCAGCDEGVTLVLNQIGLNGANGDLDVITTPISQQCITWQGGSGIGSCSATSTRNATWGQVKSLYR
jgi:hypothetical protein